jgi:hypothetical protein
MYCVAQGLDELKLTVSEACDCRERRGIAVSQRRGIKKKNGKRKKKKREKGKREEKVTWRGRYIYSPRLFTLFKEKWLKASDNHRLEAPIIVISKTENEHKNPPR